MRKNHNILGFTLIELLVVIAIIALLLSILIPSLRMAKDHAKKIHCSANLKSLSTAALLYASDNDALTPSSTNIWVDAGTNRPGWCGVTSNFGTRMPLPENEQVVGNTDPVTGLYRSQLWPYIETPDGWRCPADPIIEQKRSYGMSAQWWGRHTQDDDSVWYDSPATKDLVSRKTTDLKLPSERFIYVDQLGYNIDAYAAIWYSQPKWWNIPNYMHSGGSVNGFADGHAESYKMETQTVKMASEAFNTAETNGNLGGFKMPAVDVPESKDLVYYQRATWGKQGW